MIDWQMICDGWNSRTGYRHTVPEMLEHLYAQHGSMDKIADYIGVAHKTVSTKMDVLGLKRTRKGPYVNSFARTLDKIPDSQLATMTANDVVKLVGCSKATFYNYSMKTRRKYARYKDLNEKRKAEAAAKAKAAK